MMMTGQRTITEPHRQIKDYVLVRLYINDFEKESQQEHIQEKSPYGYEVHGSPVVYKGEIYQTMIRYID